MIRVALLTFISTLFIFCSTTVPVFVEVEPLTENLELVEPEGSIIVFKDGDEVPENTEIALLKAQLFQEDDPEKVIIDAFKYKALQLGANGLLITKNEYNIGMSRNTVRGGITSGVIRDMEAKALILK
ncbi:MAG: hypothetical protein JJ892_15160 [Balneola sp.]|nr:hypothetical protein [Balneola sp.]MBO6652328.1 hypothetical protein [Balneola sp.]MBO6712916.1 hypothetical protein [Balneola sp.]MBO6801610.1 hypothetical protein [Balneola sp.]MBO6871929.1 hypothetical protein [Balneola sp.]